MLWNGIWFTLGGIAQRLPVNYKLETRNSTEYQFDGVDGFTSVSINFISYGIFCLVAPLVIKPLGYKISMALGTLMVAFYSAAYILPRASIIYLSAFVTGCGCALANTAHGAFMSLNGTNETRNRNTSVHFVFQSGLSKIFGNLYILLAWNGVVFISSDQRIPLCIGLTVAGTLASLLTMFVKNLPYQDDSAFDLKDKYTRTVESDLTKRAQFRISAENDSSGDQENEVKLELLQINDTVRTLENIGCLNFLQPILELLKDTDMKLFIICGVYYGLQCSYSTAVLPFVITSTKSFGADSDKQAGTYGVLSGITAAITGLCLAYVGQKLPKLNNIRIISTVGTLLQVLAYVLSYCNFRAEILTGDDIGPTGYFEEPSLPVALLVAGLIVVGDICLRVAHYGYLGQRYGCRQITAAFSIYGAVQCTVAGFNMFLTSEFVQMRLQWQLLIMPGFALSNAVVFYRLSK